jgi:cysteinyl-tRNA synthetase
MTLHVYNTLTRRKEEFVPVTPGRVNIYVCGPTVYGPTHIGHAKSYVSFDVIVRYLRFSGFQVRYVQNITDVGHLLDGGEDRILRGAARDRIEPMEVVERYTRSYFEDMDTLGVARPDISPRASAHIPEQIEMIKRLIEQEHAYEVNGSVYFDVTSWPDYGKLSGRKVEEQEAGARVEVREEKNHPADFALWRRAAPEHIMRWPSPWGWGFPGWHIECSVMSTKYLGQPFDIHGGGLENQFPHHECEIAQTEAATGAPFVRYWLHNNMVTVNDREMHRSWGNVVNLKDLFERYDPLVVRYFIVSSHYRSPLDFNDAGLDAAEKSLERLNGPITLVRQRLSTTGAEAEGEVEPGMATLLAEARRRFVEAMDDDFNTPVALAALFDLTTEVNRRLNGDPPPNRATLVAIEQTYRELTGDVLGLIQAERVDRQAAEREAGLVRLLIDLRAQARQAKNWAQSDAIRDRLAELGVILEDRVEGTTWKVQ